LSKLASHDVASNICQALHGGGAGRPSSARGGLMSGRPSSSGLASGGLTTSPEASPSKPKPPGAGSGGGGAEGTVGGVRRLTFTGDVVEDDGDGGDLEAHRATNASYSPAPHPPKVGSGHM